MTHTREFSLYEMVPLATDIHTHLGVFTEGTLVEVEGYWDEVTGKSWMNSVGNFAAVHYGIRSGFAGLPFDDEVVYVKVNGLGHIIHVSELQ